MKIRNLLLTLFHSFVFLFVFSFKKIFRKIKAILTASNFHYDENIFRTAVEEIFHQGYEVEIHKILTDDDYILTAWRIINRIGGNQNQKLKKQPVILQHGLIDSSFTWIINGGNLSLAYDLYDEGYDVWMTNNRGNRYSYENKNLNRTRNKTSYWNFTWDDMAQFDLPANISYIKRITGFEKLIYIGHSQGTSQLFANICNNQEILSSIKAFVGLGPVIYVGNQKSILTRFLYKTRILEFLNIIHTLYGFLFTTRKILPLVGEFASLAPKQFYKVIECLCGFNESNRIDFKRFSLMASHEPGGTSIYTVIHWFQLMRSNTFQFYDFGQIGNLRKYGQISPPLYDTANLKKFTTPKFLIRGTKDYYVDEKDFDRLVSLLPENSTKIKVIEDYNHIDYCWAVDAKEKLYNEIVNFLKGIK